MPARPLVSRRRAASGSRGPILADADARMSAGRRVGAALFALLYRTQVRGVHHVPERGPVVLVANHAGFVDGPLAFVASPRPVHFLVKRAYFRGPLGRLLDGVGQIAITQNSADRVALSQARQVLADGGVVGVFPEGTRGAGDVATARQGAAFLALGSGARVVPVALSGTSGRTRGALPRLRSRLHVSFGEPIDLADDPQVVSLAGRARLVAATEVLRAHLAQHVRDARI